ncbi:unnamed protein product [Sphagnum jensenii]|uniref:Cytochrome P450 n=1 Tax=Sphagnum jensenii TaxID=128206 RepID=A0ABP1BY87_9BRYO
MTKLAFFGEGLLTMNGENWAKHHQIMEHVFHLEALKQVVRLMVSHVANELKSKFHIISLWHMQLRKEIKARGWAKLGGNYIL